MKIGAVVDEDGNLTPLDAGQNIAIIFEGKVRSLSNPGYGIPHGGKELAMDVILKNKVDAVVVRQGFLCPCSYKMSFGKLKYLYTKHDNINELLSDESSIPKSLLDELEPNTYAEEHHHSSNVHLNLPKV
ncbi:MAG: hypothetical protein QXG05_02270 [Nitrososphaerota archaeon]